jgi:hypothetical protein
MTNTTQGWSRAPRRRVVAALVGAAALAGTLVASAGPASAEIPGHVIVDERSASTNGPSATITAECPVGTELIGVGGSVSAASGVVIRSITPDLGDEEVVVAAHETPAGSPTSWRVSAKAVCSSPGAIPDRYLVEETGTASGGDTYEGAIADCDAGDRTLGLGFRSTAPAGRVMPMTLLPTEDSAQAVLHEDRAGLTTSWDATTVAICGGGVSAFVDWNQSPSPTSTSDTTTCDAGDTIVGGGAVIVHPTGGTGYFAVSNVSPGQYGGQDFVTASLREMAATAAVPEVYAYAICADLI